MRENHFPIIVVAVIVIQSDITICVRSCEFGWMDENEHAMKKRRSQEREVAEAVEEKKQQHMNRTRKQNHSH